MKNQDLECGLSCLIASALFGSMLYTMLYQDKHKIMQEFQQTLTVEQIAIYKKIINERMRLYIEGLLIGLLLGFIYLSYCKRSIYSACIFTMIVLIVNNGYYLLHPKTQYMVPYLETEEQRVAWLNIYVSMKNRCHRGMVLGAVAYLLVGYYASRT